MNDFTWDVKFVRLQLIASMVNRAPAGLLYVRQWNNMQYVSNAAFLLIVYSDHLRVSYQRLRCDLGEDQLSHIIHRMDGFSDDGRDFMQTEACTYNTASLIGVLAKLHGLED
ncbi:hypothetical protein GQ457_01G006570 [Hibiscus cannabinus]